VCHQDASNNSGSSNSISSTMGKLITSQDHNLWLKELPCWPHGFQRVMISKHIIIIFMNINPKGILEWRASKKDNLKRQKFQIPMLFLKPVDLFLKNIPSSSDSSHIIANFMFAL
jgi:hypothetical protein